jgi:hypothetical protein
MNSIPKFENQIFISYAHIDNEHFSEVKKGWIDHLHERLAICLAQELGMRPKIWRDPKLTGNDIFNDTIVIELSKTAVLLSVLSPRYVKSPSCQKELDDFFQSAALNGGLRFDDKHRVFKVMKTHVPIDEHPQGLRDLLGYEFYEVEPETGRVIKFDHVINSNGDKDPRYWDRLDQLVWDLKEFIKRIENPQTQTARANTSGEIIYLAETTSDLRKVRDKVKRELQQYGHTILPDKALPLKSTDLEPAVREYLKRCRISIHLIGKYYGVIPEIESKRSIVRLQHELAKERGDDDGFSRLLWIPPGLEPKDERQREFLDELRNALTSTNGSELLQVSLEDLKTIIHKKLTRKRKPDASEPGQSGRARIYLMCDQQDVDAVAPLQNFLFEQSCEVILPLFEGSETEVAEDHRENLLQCDAVLIFRGQASEGWLRMKLRELVKLPGYGRTSALLSKAVYLAPPESPTKQRFNTLEALIIRSYENFDPVLLEPFLAQIRNAQGGSQ